MIYPTFDCFGAKIVVLSINSTRQMVKNARFNFNHIVGIEFTLSLMQCRFPVCYKDISFWNNDDKRLGETDFYDLVREVAGDLVESVSLIDEFQHPKTGRQSKCFRIEYRSMDRTVTNKEIDVFQDEIRRLVQRKWLVELR